MKPKRTLICNRCVHSGSCKWSKDNFTNHTFETLNYIDAFFNFKENCIQGQLDRTYTEKHAALKELRGKVAEWKKRAR